MMIKTSATHPLRIDAMRLDAGLLGLTFCPGKQGSSLFGGAWARDLDTDLAALADWGADLVVTLMEQHEFALLHVPDLPERVRAHGMVWAHLPIRDVDVPAAAFDAAWGGLCADILRRLAEGGRVVLHCRGGLGRTGLVAALLLVENGMEAERAIAAVRAARVGAIETSAQERYVRAYRPKMLGQRLLGQRLLGV